MAEIKVPEHDHNTLLVARQPIFDLQDRVWGYELLFRNPHSGIMEGDGDIATSTVMLEGFELLRPTLQPKQHFCINFTGSFLEQELPAVLPPEICVIEILEDTQPTPGVLEGIRNLKKQGYTLSLDNYTGQPSLKPFLPLVDIVKVDVLSLSESEILGITSRLSRYSSTLLAEKVDNLAMANFCRSTGFSLFQGFFYSKAEVVRGKKLTPAQATKMRLLALLANEDTEMKEIIEVLSADVYTTYNLLKFVNSVYFGLPVKVSSVERAAVLLGSQKMRQWLFVSVLAGMDTSPRAQELVQISAFRAKFLELLALRAGADTELASKLFMAGLFSLLQSLMQIPIQDIFAKIPLPDDVMQVLESSGGPLEPWFEVMLAYESADWDAVQFYSAVFGLRDKGLSVSYAEAGSWSASLFRAARPIGKGRERKSEGSDSPLSPGLSAPASQVS